MANGRSEGGRKKKEKKKEVAGDDDWGGLWEAEGRGQPLDDGTECGEARKQEHEHLIGQIGLEPPHHSLQGAATPLNLAIPCHTLPYALVRVFDPALVFAGLYGIADDGGSLAQTVTEPNQDDEAEAGGDGWVGRDDGGFG
ncbi:hypothetical protein E4U59_007135 [Claviceps monticola]|nr:hypothetical protein E4U59_007135 [Claviceps monticola]